MNFNRIVAIALLACLTAVTRAQEAKAVSPQASSTAVSDINNRFDDLAAEARGHFSQAVGDARKAFEQALADANEKRVAALKDLAESAMHDKDLELAVAARNEIAKPVVEKAAILQGQREKATIEITAHIDGSDMVSINQKGMSWKHREWDNASNIAVNGIVWDLSKSTDFPNSGDTKFLPFVADFRTARVASRRGRDIVAMEKTDESMTVVFADCPEGGDEYKITIELQSAGTHNAGTHGAAGQ